MKEQLSFLTALSFFKTKNGLGHAEALRAATEFMNKHEGNQIYEPTLRLARAFVLDYPEGYTPPVLEQQAVVFDLPSERDGGARLFIETPENPGQQQSFGSKSIDSLPPQHTQKIESVTQNPWTITLKEGWINPENGTRTITASGMGPLITTLRKAIKQQS